MQSSRNNIIAKANDIVFNDRAKEYGTFEEGYKFICDMVKLIKGVDIDPETVAIIMLSLKIARHRHKPKEDNFIDMIGYIQGWSELFFKEGTNDQSNSI